LAVMECQVKALTAEKEEQSLQIHRVADAMKQLSLAVKDNQMVLRLENEAGGCSVAHLEKVQERFLHEVAQYLGVFPGRVLLVRAEGISSVFVTLTVTINEGEGEGEGVLPDAAIEGLVGHHLAGYRCCEAVRGEWWGKERHGLNEYSQLHPHKTPGLNCPHSPAESTHTISHPPHPVLHSKPVPSPTTSGVSSYPRRAPDSRASDSKHALESKPATKAPRRGSVPGSAAYKAKLQSMAGVKPSGGEGTKAGKGQSTQQHGGSTQTRPAQKPSRTSAGPASARPHLQAIKVKEGAVRKSGRTPGSHNPAAHGRLSDYR